MRDSGGLRWGVEPICSVLEIAPSTYYDAKHRPPSARAVRDAELGPQLKALWERNYSVYGRRKLTTAQSRIFVFADEILSGQPEGSSASRNQRNTSSDTR
jgi:hypothetical protein